MNTPLPEHAVDLNDWSQLKPAFDELTAAPLSVATCEAWLADWTRVAYLVYEAFARANVATTINTEDADAKKRLFHFLENILPPVQAADQALKEKLLASGLEPDGFDVPLRNLRAEAEIFRLENLPLITEEGKLGNQFDEIKGAQTVAWDGVDLPLPQLNPHLQNADRSTRERAWRLVQARHLKDRGALNGLWTQFLALRVQMARNAGFSDYRAYRWKLLKRFDYTPSDSQAFQNAIEQVVVPAVTRLNTRHKALLGLDTLRPWDANQHLFIDSKGRPNITPYSNVAELESRAATVFAKVDPDLGAHFETMRREGLLDLPSRKGKAPGGYCTAFPIVKRPFIFMNAVGLHGDVDTLLHEGGHAFHVFEAAELASHHLQDVPMEFAEVASMAMELLASPYLAQDQGGFYSPADAARARFEHLDGMLRFWPYMAVVDAFQHWVYTHAEEAADPAACDAMWSELYRRFHPDVDVNGIEPEIANGWQQKLHIFQAPFYYIEYGLAQLGAAQIWRNAKQDQTGAVAAYRRALSLGGSAPLPALFAAAGAKFAFDANTLGDLVGLMETEMNTLRAAGG
ncbi:MAG TPA: M3 family oligoendopeptidase [Thermoflexales bacterium]|nr:M3 family oligoendopeptidase [Thermoflexales bacterium]